MRAAIAVLLAASLGCAQHQAPQGRGGGRDGLAPGVAAQLHGSHSTGQCGGDTGSGQGWISCGAVPSGMITFIAAGTCPAGWTENDSLAGYNVLVTTSGAGDVGTSAAQNLTASAQTFTGSSGTTSAVSAGTPAGTNTLGAYSPGAISWPAGVPTNASGSYTPGSISWPANVPSFAGTALSAHTHTIAQSAFGTTKFTTSGTGTAAYTSGGTVTSPSGNPSLTLTPAGTIAWPANPPTIGAGSFTQPTISWPAGVPAIGAGSFTQPTFTGVALGTHMHTLTPAGTNSSSAVTGNTAYFKVIACQKD